MRKIAVVGAHGVGKTTLCKGLCRECKRSGFTYELVEEVARSCPLPIGPDQGLEATLWILAEQIKREMEATLKKPDFIICDRSALDPLVYLIVSNQEALPTYLIDFCDAYSMNYEDMYLVRPSSLEIKDDGFRNTDKTFQLAINGMFTSWVARTAKFINADEIFCEELDTLCIGILNHEDGWNT